MNDEPQTLLHVALIAAGGLAAAFVAGVRKWIARAVNQPHAIQIQAEMIERLHEDIRSLREQNTLLIAELAAARVDLQRLEADLNQLRGSRS